MKKSIIIGLVTFLSFTTGYAGNVLIENVLSEPGKTVDLKISLSSAATKNVGLQFDLTLPDGFSLEKGADGNVFKLSASQANDMACNVQDMGGGKNRFILFSNTLQSLKAGELLSFRLKANNELSFGGYTITVGEVAFSDANGTVKKEGEVNATVTLIDTFAGGVVITANSYTREYGEENPVFAFTSEGESVTGTPEITSEAIATSPVGTYPIKISKGTVTNDNDYYVNGTLTITKAPLTVTAKAYTIKQGEALPAFEVDYTGFKNGETASVMTKQPTITTKATSASAPGVYDIIVRRAEAENYEISYVKGTLTIIAADPVTVTANSYTINYGDALPVFEYTSSGGTLFGSPEIICEATATSSVGTYPIVINKGSVTNYNDSYVNGTLTVTKAPLTVTAKSYSIKQGEPLPNLTVSYKGFKNGETAAVLTKQPTITCAATSASEPGTYDITVSGATADNYEITHVKGTLRIRSLVAESGDLNDDGEVDVTDVVELIDMVLAGIYDASGDINGDGDVDVTDVVELIDMVLSGE